MQYSLVICIYGGVGRGGGGVSCELCSQWEQVFNYVAFRCTWKYHLLQFRRECMFKDEKKEVRIIIYDMANYIGTFYVMIVKPLIPKLEIHTLQLRNDR